MTFKKTMTVFSLCSLLSSTVFASAEELSPSNEDGTQSAGACFYDLTTELLYQISENLAASDVRHLASCDKVLSESLNPYAQERFASFMEELFPNAPIKDLETRKTHPSAQERFEAMMGMLPETISIPFPKVTSRCLNDDLLMLSKLEAHLPALQALMASDYTQTQKLTLVGSLIHNAEKIHSNDQLKALVETMPIYLGKIAIKDRIAPTGRNQGKITSNTDDMLPGMVKMLLKMSPQHIQELAQILNGTQQFSGRHNIYIRIFENLKDRGAKTLATYCEIAKCLIKKQDKRHDNIFILSSLSSLKRSKMRTTSRSDHIEYGHLTTEGLASGDLMRDMKRLHELKIKRGELKKDTDILSNAASSSASSSTGSKIN